jgi:hypothetical protein
VDADTGVLLTSTYGYLKGITCSLCRAFLFHTISRSPRTDIYLSRGDTINQFHSNFPPAGLLCDLNNFLERFAGGPTADTRLVFCHMHPHLQCIVSSPRTLYREIFNICFSVAAFPGKIQVRHCKWQQFLDTLCVNQIPSWFRLR